MSPRDRLPTLLLGIAIGVLGSFSDDLLGTGAAVEILQVALWIISAAIVIPAALARRPRRDAPRGRLEATT